MQVELPYKFEMFLGWQALVGVLCIMSLSFYFLFVGQLVSGLVASLSGLYLARRRKKAKAFDKIAQELARKLIDKDPD